MRILTLNLLAVALLLFGATSASALAFNMTWRNPAPTVSSGDQVIVDVFFDADIVDILAFSVSVINSNPSMLQYDGPASAALPIIYPAPPYAGTTGAQPSYLLYTAGSGGGMLPLIPATALYPQQTPNWLTWPAPPPGTQQVNINYAESNITDSFNTTYTASNLWVASLVFNVVGGGETTLTLSNTNGGNVFGIGTGTVLDPGTISLSAPIVVVPEPTTAMLIGLGLFGLAISGRRK